jgi:hypothetical protein
MADVKPKRSTPRDRGTMVSLTIHIDPETSALLERLAPRRRKGMLIMRLIHEHELRREVREATLAEVATLRSMP